ncbi:hypothetical protein FEM48_Zijuj05G0128900 [Ziziphus jujuba var. spinosa]|uniref:Uncharacterized protein n=1 Tax=Ziziphus jujuba var. spinosa TaxID=714518 RepID=A0A978VEY1_ZIZJJ|nr:hypothetical protein FEM48_Zijuj05G0128900 [Ziziphus jujuba var. spinosa]
MIGSPFAYEFLCACYKRKFSRLFYVSSSIWHAIKEHQYETYQGYGWITGKDSNVKFFWNNWMGKSVLSLLNLQSRVGDSNIKCKVDLSSSDKLLDAFFYGLSVLYASVEYNDEFALQFVSCLYAVAIWEYVASLFLFE